MSGWDSASLFSKDAQVIPVCRRVWEAWSEGTSKCDGLLWVTWALGGESLLVIWGWMILCCPVHCEMFTSISGLYPPDASSSSLSCNNERCLQASLTFRGSALPSFVYV